MSRILFCVLQIFTSTASCSLLCGPQIFKSTARPVQSVMASVMADKCQTRLYPRKKAAVSTERYNSSPYPIVTVLFLWIIMITTVLGEFHFSNSTYVRSLTVRQHCGWHPCKRFEDLLCLWNRASSRAAYGIHVVNPNTNRHARFVVNIVRIKICDSHDNGTTNTVSWFGEEIMSIKFASWGLIDAM